MTTADVGKPHPDSHPKLRRLRRTWLAAALTLLVADGIWLGLLMADTYQAQIGHLMRPQPAWAAVLCFYLLYPLGLVRLVLWPPGLSATAGQAAGRGAVVGLMAYGAYDLTNLATLQGWPLGLSLLDVLWGAAVSALAAAAAWRAAPDGRPGAGATIAG